jgi:hypothetical protein
MSPAREVDKKTAAQIELNRAAIQEDTPLKKHRTGAYLSELVKKTLGVRVRFLNTFETALPLVFSI